MKNYGKYYDLTNGGKAFGAGSSSGTDRSPNEYQKAVVYDLLSEGPIQGLVDGTNSIFLDKTGVTIGDTKHQIVNLTNVSYTASTRTLVDSDNQNLFNTLEVEDGTRYVTVQKGKKSLTGNGSSVGASGTENSTRVTTSSNFFSTDDLNSAASNAASTTLYASTPPQHIRIEGAGYEGADSVLIAKIVKYIDEQTVEIDVPIGRTFSNKTISVDKVATLASKTNANTIVLANISQYGTDNVDVSGTEAVVSTTTKTVDDTHVNYEDFKYEYRGGTRYQPIINSFRGAGSASVVEGPNQVIEPTNLSSLLGSNNFTTTGDWNTSVGTATASPVIVNSSAIANPSEIDRVKLTFKFAQMIATKSSSGDEDSAICELRIFFGFKREGDNSFTELLIFGLSDAEILARGSGNYTKPWKFSHNSGRIRAETKAPFIETFTINTGNFQPFTSYQVRIERLTPSSGIHGDYDHSSPCTLQSVEHIIEDKLRYPYAAYTALEFDAESFSKIPKRSYDLKGLLVQVPTNYFPRGEGDRTRGEYDRNITTGANTGSYQKWDGNFRGDTSTFDVGSPNYNKVWTDNPAWIFYDLVTNNRYGIGKYIDSSQIDKYELFKIARYCDELVSDGKGGSEPRFTANLYLKESAEALKVLKDVASTFRGMMYWLNGEIQFSQNKYQQPIYTFSKANVIGNFKYTSTKQQYRSNQIRVTWNNPDSMYKQQVEIVEDTNNILETGKIIPKDVVAFGCTSQGQAHRFGKWNLFSEIMETEGVSFSTSINAGFLKPGDVVLVQDTDVDNIRYSGRVSSSSSSSSINIDSAVDLSSGNTFTLSIIFPQGGAYLGDSIKTINDNVSDANDTSSYTRGELVTHAKVNGTVVEITTADQAANAVDSSGEALNLIWNPYSRIETKTITTTSASATTLAVSGAFSSAPTQDYIWAIREYDSSGALTEGSAKQFVITGVQQSELSTFTITGVQYSPAKFDMVDRGYVLEQGIDVDKLPSFNEVVPVPGTLTLSLAKDLNQGVEDAGVASTSSKDKIRVNWTAPVNSNGTRYQHISHYEIKHNANTEGKYQTIRAGKNDSQVFIKYGAPKLVTVKLQAVNTNGTKSNIIQRKIKILNSSLENTLSKIGLIPKGGSINQTVTIDDSTGLLEIGSSTYQFDSPNGETFLNSSATASTYQQSFSGMGASAEAYLLFDQSDSTDRFKAVQIHTDTTAQDFSGNTPGYQYIKEVGASNNGVTQVSGTVSGTIGDNIITGSSTNFDSDFIPGDRIIIDAVGTTRFYTTVAFINNDTSIQLSDTLPRTYSSVNIFKLSFRPDTTFDAILSKITTDGSTTYSIAEQYAVTKGITGGDGLNNATVYLYKTTNSATESTLPSGDATFTFSSGTLGSFATNANGWSQTITSVSASNQYLWTTSAVASSTDSTVVIADSAWATPKLLSTFGESGDDGLRTIQGYLFYEKTTSGAPSAPSGNTYTFSTGVVSGSGINDSGTTNVWKNSPNTQDATSSNTFYTVRYYGTESAANSSTITVAYTNVVQQTSFTGVVTFSGGTLTDGTSSVDPIEADDLGSGGTTVIDGGRITTGSISSSNLSGTTDGSAFTTAGTRLTLSNGAIASKNFRIDSSGNAAFQGNITGASGTFSGNIEIGSGSSIFKADTNGIYLGNATFADAPFSVDTAGVVRTTSRITAGSGITQATLTGQDANYRFWSGGTTGNTADFSVSKDGEIIAKKISIYNNEGGLVFSSESGFTDLALTDISSATGTPVQTVSNTFSGETTSSDWQEITLTQNTNLTVTVALPSSFGGVEFSNTSVSDAIQGAIDEIPANFTLALEYSTNNGSSWNSINTTVGSNTATSQQFNRTTSISPTVSEYSVEVESEAEPGFYVAFADVRRGNSLSNYGSVDKDGFTKITGTISNLSGSSGGTTYQFRSRVSTTDTGYNSTNKVTSTASRTLTITDTSGNGFLIDDGSGSQTTGEGDITAVNITAGNGLTGTVNTSSGAHNQTLAIGAGTGITVNADDVALSNTAVTAGSYTNTNLTVDAQGRITAASNGSSGSGATNISISRTTSQVTVVSSTGTNGVILEATGTAAGVMTTTMHDKLDGIAANANNYVHPTFAGDDINIDTGALTGATVISDLDFNITTDTNGHVTDANASVATRTLTLANLGYTGATNADNYGSWSFDTSSNGTDETVTSGDVVRFSAGTGMTVNHSGDTITFTCNVVNTDTDTNYFLDGISKSGNTLTFSVNGTTNQSYTFGSNAFTSTTIPTNNNQLTNGAGYTTNTGTVTSVTGGTGLNGTVTTSGSLNLDSNLINKVDYIGGGGTGDYFDMSSTTIYKLNFVSTEKFRWTYLGNFDADGDITAYSTTTGSDIRLKENVRDLEGALDKTLKLRGVKFDWKDEHRPKDQLGFIAQEVEEVLPEIVKEIDTVGKDGEKHKTVNYPAVVPLLVEAIKELKAEIEELKNDNRK